MPRKGENIYKRTDGRWEGRYIQYRRNGKAKYGYVYAKTYGEVKRALLLKKSEVMRQSEPLNIESVLYSKVLEDWLSTISLNAKESTCARYHQLVTTHILPHLGSCSLSEIKTRQIENLMQHLLTEGRLDGRGGLSPKTVTDILTIIKSTMDYAGYQNLAVMCNLGRLTVKKKEKEMRVLTHSEQDALVKTLTSDMDLYKFGVLLALFTGIRIGELCALQWVDFDFTASTVRINKTMQRIQNVDTAARGKTKIIITEPKSQCSIRKIPLPPFLAEMALSFCANPEAFVLSGTESRYVEPRTMQNRFRKCVEQSGIGPANFHALRHTFATRCIELGFEVKSLSEILGHANVNITLNRYVHASLELKQANMNKLMLMV